MSVLARASTRFRHRGSPPARLAAAACVAGVAAAAAVGGAAAGGGDRGLYERLDLPAWAPPAEVFAPVWAGLYVITAAAGALAGGRVGRPGGRLAVGLFLGQLAVQAAWTPLFFRAERFGLALADVSALMVLAVLTTAAFWRVRRPAALLMLPYVAWVAYATALNAAVVAGN